MRAIAFFLCAIVVVSPLSAQQQVITDLPEVRGPFTLTAVYDSAASFVCCLAESSSYAMQTICLGSLMRSVPQAAAAM